MTNFSQCQIIRCGESRVCDTWKRRVTSHLSWSKIKTLGTTPRQCSVLQRVTQWYSVVQCGAVRCSMSQCVTSYSKEQDKRNDSEAVQCVAVCHSVSQCVAVCCSVLQCVAVCCRVLQCDLILRTRVCGTSFIPQHCWVVDFHLTKMVGWKCFVPGLYQLRKGKSTGLALEYFYMIHRGGRYTAPEVSWMRSCNPGNPPFVWFVQLTPNWSIFLMCTKMSEPGSISASFQWTGSTPAGFQQVFRVE